MMGMKDKHERVHIEFISLEDLVPEKHLVRKLDATMPKLSVPVLSM